MKAAGSRPLALHERLDNALRLAALDPAAAALGLHEGQPLAEARALYPELAVAPIDRAADAADFAKLLGGLMRYSPLVGGGGFGVAFVDIEGAAHLFGGEEGLAQDAVLRLRRTGLAARAAVAATPGCAYAAAAFSVLPQAVFRLIPSGGEREALSALPVAALRIGAKTAGTLKSLGLATVGALMARPRKEIGKRFGATLLARLDEATGALAEPISPIAPLTDYAAAAVLAEPVESLEAALVVAETLADELAARLERAGLGARRFEFALYRLDMSVERAAIVLGAPTRDPGVMLRLLRLKLEKGERPVDPGFGFESFRLSAFETAALPARQADGFSTVGGIAGACADRLVNRLGAEAFRLGAVESHVPERAEARASALRPVPPWTDEVRLRPIALLDPPEPIGAVAALPDGPPAAFRWRRVSYRVARAAGPERILGEWRRREDFLRDYYRIEDEAGRRYWVFRQGLYEDGAKWFLHGFFA